MSITEQGIEGEKLAREWLKKHKLHNMQQLDWIVKAGNKYFIIECKMRELFKPPPFLGTGLDIRQIELRRQIYNDLGIETILFIICEEKNTIYWQRLFAVLEKTIYHNTKNKIRIYNINNFKSEEIVKSSAV